MCLVIQLSSCIKELDVTIPSIPQKVVINSLFCPDSILKIHVSLSEGVENEIQIVENAQIRLYENDIFLQNVSYLSKGWYSSNYHPKAGMKYKIEINVEGFDMVTAESSIPENASILSFTCDLIENLNQNSPANSLTKLVFDDVGLDKNYYEFSTFVLIPGDNIVEFMEIGSAIQTDLSLKLDSDLEFNPKTFYFSDELFHNSEKTLLLNGLGWTNINPLNNEIENGIFSALFKILSSEYYNFRKSWTKHVYNQNTDIHNDNPIVLLFKGDPIEMYTNVNGGYGIFAGYKQQSKEVTYIP